VKTKDILQLTVALVIFVVAGYLIYLQVVPASKRSSKNPPTYEKITPVPASYDQTALNRLSDSSQIRDFYTVPDLHSGLGNTEPFGPLR
jgi:hypothetical protein